MTARATRIDELLDLSLRAHHALAATGCETVGELLDLGPQLHGLVGRATLRELAEAVPRRWRERITTPPPRPRRIDIVPPPKRRRAWCPACDVVSSRTLGHASDPCRACGGPVQHRTRGRVPANGVCSRAELARRAR